MKYSLNSTRCQDSGAYPQHLEVGWEGDGIHVWIKLTFEIQVWWLITVKHRIHIGFTVLIFEGYWTKLVEIWLRINFYCTWSMITQLTLNHMIIDWESWVQVFTYVGNCAENQYMLLSNGVFFQVNIKFAHARSFAVLFPETCMV